MSHRRLIDRLERAIAAQGAPPIRAQLNGQTVTFEGEIMVRVRAADALSHVWVAWRDFVEEADVRGAR
jgi:hypothetical protein